MKSGRVAKSLGIDVKTVINWSSHPALQRFFSAGASKPEQYQRDFSEEDLLVLNTIRVERARNASWEEIATMLESGERNAELPPNAMLVETTAPIAQYARTVALIAERDAALKQVEKMRTERAEQESAIQHLQGEIGRLNREIGEVQHLRFSNEQKDQLIERLQNQIQQLNREIGKLEGKVEYLEDKNQNKE